MIERAAYLSDQNVLAKAYQRRGYALEQLEKYKEAREDMQRVKEIQPNNMQASQALTRLGKAMRDTEREEERKGLEEVEMGLGKLKDEGNKCYGEKQFEKAVEKFTEGIELCKVQGVEVKGDIKVKVGQLHTNRALAYH